MVWQALLIAVAVGADDNLLANGGFEDLSGTMPSRWQVYVASREGVEGRVDDVSAASGTCCVMLHKSEAYEPDPINNWSQHVFGDFSGKELLVRGQIKTEEATEAAIWLQCWRKRPAHVVQWATTSYDSPMSGTCDWTAVEMKLKVTERTDFLMVRCVLKGSGTAWFDDIMLSESGEREECPEAGQAVCSQPEDSSLEPDKETQDVPAQAPPEQQDNLSAHKLVEAQLVESQQVLVDTNRTLRETNALLAQEIEALRAEVSVLREELAALRTASHDKKADEPERRVPPLVPHVANAEAAR